MPESKPDRPRCPCGRGKRGPRKQCSYCRQKLTGYISLPFKRCWKAGGAEPGYRTDPLRLARLKLYAKRAKKGLPLFE